ncbi:MAG: phosphoribosylaminoimidazolesuccinocarboxamide synthase, partial [Candidatus Tectomicrobia bacterium]|nr:phosphoribosylaminoimidazolesuccinocarboxamide synthase [Candidatus Tectomicrobia bacterium]
MKDQVILQTDFKELKLLNRGKVRDVYDLDDKLLIVTTDRISAFDVILPNGIPGKGRVLNLLSCHWFTATSDIIPNHLITSRVSDFPPVCRRYEDILADRSMLVWKTKPVEIECVVRGYLSGSAWNEYKETGALAGIACPKNLLESSKLNSPVFTPAIKSKEGHDENITIEKMKALIGVELAERIIKTSTSIFNKASRMAEEKGIIVAD